MPYMVNSLLEKKWLTCLLWLAIVSVLLFAYINTPMMSDDFRYSLMYSAEQGCLHQQVTSWSDYASNVAEIYKGMEGRLANMLIAWVMTLGGGKCVFNILAVAVVCGLLYLLCRYFFHSCKFLPLVTVTSLLFLFIPAHDGSVLWASGAINYLWGSLILTFFLTGLRRIQKGKNSWFVAILGLCCGCYHEALSLPLLASMASVAVAKKERRSRAYFVTMAMVALGAIVLLASPGIWHRADSGLASTFLVAVATSLTWLTAHALLPAILFTLVLWFRHHAWSSKTWQSEDVFLAAMIFYNAGFAMLVGYSGSWGGGYYYFNFSMLLGTLRLLATPLQNTAHSASRKQWLWCGICLALLSGFSAKLISMAQFGHYVEESLLEQARKGARACVVNDHYGYSERIVLGAPGVTPTSWTCKAAAYMKGIDHPYYLVLNNMHPNRSVYRNFGDNDERNWLIDGDKLIIRLPHGFLLGNNKINGSMKDGTKCLFTGPANQYELLPLLQRYIGGRKIFIYGTDYVDGIHYIIIRLHSELPETITVTLSEETSTKLSEKTFNLQ